MNSVYPNGLGFYTVKLSDELRAQMPADCHLGCQIGQLRIYGHRGSSYDCSWSRLDGYSIRGPMAFSLDYWAHRHGGIRKCILLMLNYDPKATAWPAALFDMEEGLLCRSSNFWNNDMPRYLKIPYQTPVRNLLGLKTGGKTKYRNISYDECGRLGEILTDFCLDNGVFTEISTFYSQISEERI